jgi:hypothetical protein
MELGKQALEAVLMVLDTQALVEVCKLVVEAYIQTLEAYRQALADTQVLADTQHYPQHL